MKKKISLFIIVIVALNLYAQDPSDCPNSIISCGNNNLSLDVNGGGNIQELNNTNTCSVDTENNSLWIKVTVATSGTLGFTLTPASTNIIEDYDFFVFGPNVTCNNLGFAIRCSTTNPQAANQGNNLTGMNGTETDISEGPGSDGNSFVKWLDVTMGESYYLVLDRPAGNSAFSLVWTGTATFSEPPVNNFPANQSINLEECDVSGDGLATFDLTQNEAAIVGAQNVTTSYHTNISDAQIGVNPITNITNFSSANATLYLRLTDNITDCFTVIDFDLIVHYLTVSQPPDLTFCDTNNDGIYTFDLSQQNNIIIGTHANPQVSYHLSQTDAATNIAPIATSFTNTQNPQTIWARLEDTATGCFGLTSFKLEVFDTPIANSVLDWITCDDMDNDGFYTFDLSTLNTQILNGQNAVDRNISFHHTQQNADMNIDALDLNYTNTDAFTPETIFVRIENVNNTDCYNTTSFHINVIENPVFDVDEETKYICINLLPQTVPFNAINPNSNYSYSWKDANGVELSTTTILNATVDGDYTVTATTTDGNNCSSTKTVHLLQAAPAVITNVIIKEYFIDDKFSVAIEINGISNYEYAIAQNGILSDYQEEPLFLNLSPGLYTVYVRETSGCGVVSKDIAVFGFPKFFTPNNDGINDSWQVKQLAFTPNAKIYIFDRFGKALYQFYPAKNQGWNGFYKNALVPRADYWFTAEITNHKGEIITRRGHFSLKN